MRYLFWRKIIMKKLLSVILAAAAVVSMVTGCSKVSQLANYAEESEYESMASVGKELYDEIKLDIPTKDRAGNDIKVPETVNTIVSMAPSTTQVLIDLGLGDKIVGIDTNSVTYADKLPAGVTQFDMMSPDNEAIAALKPDIVFTSGMSSVGGTSPFQSLIDSGVCVADIPSPASIEGISEDIIFIGTCTGKGKEALAYAKGLEVFLNGVREAGKQIPEDQTKTVLVMMNVPSAEYPTIYTFGKGTYMDEMISIIGAKNVFGDQEGWLSVSSEDAIAANPDVILMDCNWMPDAADQVKALPGWENVNAVKNGEVYAVNEDLCSRPNHHISEATLEWARFVYADRFTNYKESFEDIKNDLWQTIVG